MNDIKSYIDKQLSDIEISAKLEETILKKTEKGKEEKIGGFVFSSKKLLLTAAVVCLLLTGTITAFATASPILYDWIYSVNPKWAALLYPVNLTAEDQGIKVEVLYAVNDAYNTMVYFTVQDITGENRIDESLDLCDAYYVEGPSAFNVRLLSFDEETNTAFCVMRGFGTVKLSNKLSFFQLTKMMNNKKTYDWYDTGISLQELAAGEAEILSSSEFADIGGSAWTEDELPILKPDEMEIPLGDDIDFVTISNMGFVDGKLHIQTKWEKSYDNHGQLLLLDKTERAMDEEKALSCDNYYFRTEEDAKNCGNDMFAHHIEFIYDIKDWKELEKYRLWASFVEDGLLIEGKWDVNFRFDDAEKMEMKNTGNLAQKIEITPIGAYIEGYTGEYESIRFSVKKEDGSKVGFSSFSTDDAYNGENGLCDVSMMFVSPIELDEIQSVMLDGEELYKK
ncbi:DUF4179 domain-containing protein [Sinanaerobacter sp. ZZT-01]|uniref:DUF4179 domain-containing protein n=1 Tax=Sinanaerobacter sp. ZZT-01 TaxID=3111540 RepID=UPI002D77E2DE|nr:DUF4179 domain-containing protein [Sinanaerobacter sp. ZZT-01]WRR94469.1 DUF4179 domain-containing protein [Sinanaerobacter sp. ZZT-01]